MYEENNTPVFRRIIVLALAFVALVVVLWLLVWLIFFRHHNPTNVAPKHKETSQSQSTQSSSSEDNSSNQTPGTTPSTPAPTPGSTPAQTPTSAPAPNNSGTINTPASTTTPNNLANTGPGNVVAPVAVAVVAGSSLYYVRLHRKLRSS
jgi:cytoskeletal protein RodZ